MELLLAGVAVWALLALCLGVLLGRSVRDAEEAEQGTAPAAGGPQASAEADRQVV